MIEGTLIEYLKAHLKGMTGYEVIKPVTVPYPTYVVSSTMRRGESIHGNGGKGLGYEYDVQINVLATSSAQAKSMTSSVLQALDGYSGLLGGLDVIDCRLDNVINLGLNHNKVFEVALEFSIKTNN
ncbi:hypothetical protein [Vibrio parahaemolyticus]|uniref:hypothetical protein n=1 Tax=Vibrio parahaemolyticus TaxID=670 RepID=UPI001EC5E6B9|nr:hypothetical protein [Vibrio parahaemolyticus]EID0057165.1 hypothetical protein [Vibrio parahaemolyticus]ELK3867022.1 hypothetical protein [Vibrio parahaemolyticus]ELZ1477455.1 hypothetical protein [Vibrio parahaemolyticus]